LVSRLWRGGIRQRIPSAKRCAHAEARLVAVSTAQEQAKQAASKYGAEYCASDYEEVLADPRVHAVIIATRHNHHKPMAIAAAKAGKHVSLKNLSRLPT
jgi:predicted dehydrogenase